MSTTSCPYCGQVLSNEDAIQHLRENEKNHDQKLLAAAEFRYKEQLKKETEAARAAERKKAQEERAQAVQADLAKLRPQLELQARQAIEKDFNGRERVLKDALLKADAQNKQLQEKLDGVTAADRGEFGEEDLLQVLTRAFPEDDVQRVGRGRAGADIVQVVRYRVGVDLVQAGKLVYENKDQAQWRSDFIDQARAAREIHETPHVVLVSKVFPTGQKDLLWIQGVAVVHPARVVPLAQVMRTLIIEAHRAGLTREDLSQKLEDLYEYLNGETFRQALEALVGAGEELRQQLQQERKSHERTWVAREQAYTMLIKRATGIEAAIRSILEKPVVAVTATASVGNDSAVSSMS